MKRLIIVPQYPTDLRYQDWWWDELPKHLEQFFDEVIVLGLNSFFGKGPKSEATFAPLEKAVDFEMLQIEEYLNLQLEPEDVLLLNDISYPGLFANILFHKRPLRCYTICHATSKNAYDYFEGVREFKYPVEEAIAKLFDKVIVASNYHKEKLGWNNINVLPLPESPIQAEQIPMHRHHWIVSVARKTPQKRNLKVEEYVVRHFHTSIKEPNSRTWKEYYTFLSHSKIMLITSAEETFGYQVLDAIMTGCIPLAPNKFSYPELLPRDYLYDTPDELVSLIHKVTSGALKPLKHSLVYNESLNFYSNLAKLMQ